MGRAKGFIDFINEESKGKGPRLDPIIRRKANESCLRCPENIIPKYPFLR